jgi:hypothetical protein
MARHDFVLLQHNGDGLILVDGRLSFASAFCYRSPSPFELVCDAQVVHHQPARLVLEDAVHPGDGLHQPVPPHRLVDVHGVQAGASKPVSHMSRTMTIFGTGRRGP